MPERTYAVFGEIALRRREVVACLYSRWSRFFPRHVPKAAVLGPLPAEFIAYLESDSIRLPQHGPKADISADSDNEYSDWEDSDEETDPVAPFSAFHSRLVDTLKAFKGLFMVKFNWSAPKDAKWILVNNTLRCADVSDVYLVLNASDHIVHDLSYAFDECVDKEDLSETVEPELVIKEWIDLNPALEFRVFVHEHRIIGISQRDLNYYDYLEDLKPTIVARIRRFFEEVMVVSEFPNKSYIMDVYVPRPFDKVVIIDINPFSRNTDLLLFTWPELLEHTDSDFETRLITETNLGRFRTKDHSENQVPLEVMDASINSAAMVELVKEWDRLGK